MTTHPLQALLAAPLLLACVVAGAQSAATGCQPLETRAANAPSQRPAFAGQTRACAAPRSAPVKVTVLATGLVKPWAVEPLPDGAVLVTEKPGRMRIVSANGTLGAPIAGVPAVDARGQGGLLDVALSPGFATDRTVYWSYSEPRSGGNGTSVAKGVLSADRTRLEQVSVILRTLPTYDGDKHYGSRLAFGPDGMLYVTTGERSDRVTRPQAQAMDSHNGKILRIRPDGSVPPDNPFVGRAGARPEIWSLGQRNVQAAGFDPQGSLWVVEMGTRGGDELNLIEKGKNYGWPVIAYGLEYSGLPIGEGATAREGMAQPQYYWDPVIAPSGAQWYTGDAFPAWKGNLLVGSLRDKKLVRLVIEGQRVVGEEWLLADRGKRVRDVRQDKAGAVYLVTDEEDGEVWKLTPGS
ncbi:PQQ-dependent sugar dehydrogenase [Piscinibacter sp. HJYY11]|uniref:PQQ-dependent sugar dehydrogenase n=1 Tax=Piscinibacter sp. HJYY11 TaxID=2801333 RepID=UPI00191F88EB|nr:PQQ-dependent sugar dehydrogenase [Piscinibacter sp. HJYY11]MBL0727176.1 PQQ-dependent sugar dehydrogenase [Piscinibacter sp. HJYY11]